MKFIKDLDEPALSRLLGSMANRIVDTAARQEVEKPSFVLLVFNDPAVTQYIANVNRSDCIKALREAADRLEKNQDVERD